MAMAACRDIEGWRAISQLRNFDTTPCFEEGVLLPSLLAAIFLAATMGSLFHLYKEPLERSRNSIRILKAKLVCRIVFYITNLSRSAAGSTGHLLRL